MPELPEPVDRLIRAANDHDTEAFLACFTAEGFVDDWGRTFQGQDIRGWSDAEFIGQQVTLDVTDVTTSSAQTIVTAQVGGNGFNGPSHFSYQLDGDLVAAMTIRE